MTLTNRGVVVFNLLGSRACGCESGEGFAARRMTAKKTVVMYDDKPIGQIEHDGGAWFVTVNGKTAVSRSRALALKQARRLASETGALPKGRIPRPPSPPASSLTVDELEAGLAAAVGNPKLKMVMGNVHQGDNSLVTHVFIESKATPAGLELRFIAKRLLPGGPLYHFATILLPGRRGATASQVAKIKSWARKAAKQMGGKVTFGDSSKRATFHYRVRGEIPLSSAPLKSSSSAGRSRAQRSEPDPFEEMRAAQSAAYQQSLRQQSRRQQQAAVDRCDHPQAEFLRARGFTCDPATGTWAPPQKSAAQARQSQRQARPSRQQGFSWDRFEKSPMGADILSADFWGVGGGSGARRSGSRSCSFCPTPDGRWVR